MIAFCCVGGYFIYSISVLLNYHRNLLKTGTLTKEYLGTDINNLRVSGQFDAGGIINNLKLIKHNY